ncbi:MAG: NADPH:quinone oxidoreductase family protein [Pseudomonadota bacterium]
MKALASIAPGGPETLTLTDIPAPVAGPGQVVIAVKACAINFPDALMIEDRYQFRPERPFAPGGEVSGTILAVGPGVTNVAPGDRVMALTLSGGLAEQVRAEAIKTYPLPADVSWDDGAALLMTYGTVIHALKDRGRIKPGDTVLVLGAAGGIGIAAVELAHAFGARVIAGVSDETKAAAARESGADDVVVYGRAPFDKAQSRALADAFKAACGADGAQIVVDPVGGDYSEPALRAIGWEGRFLVVGFPAGIAKLPLNLPLLKACDICGVFLGGFLDRDPDHFAAQVAELVELLRAGRFRPRIGAVLPLERGGEGIALLATRQAIGKVVVRIGD